MSRNASESAPKSAIRLESSWTFSPSRDKDSAMHARTTVARASSPAGARSIGVIIPPDQHVQPNQASVHRT